MPNPTSYPRRGLEMRKRKASPGDGTLLAPEMREDRRRAVGKWESRSDFHGGAASHPPWPRHSKVSRAYLASAWPARQTTPEISAETPFQFHNGGRGAVDLPDNGEFAGTSGG